MTPIPRNTKDWLEIASPDAIVMYDVLCEVWGDPSDAGGFVLYWLIEGVMSTEGPGLWANGLVWAPKNGAYWQKMSAEDYIARFKR